MTTHASDCELKHIGGSCTCALSSKDIVERLRSAELQWPVRHDAAEEIERLRAELFEAKSAVGLWQAVHGKSTSPETTLNPSVATREVGERASVTRSEFETPARHLALTVNGHQLTHALDYLDGELETELTLSVCNERRDVESGELMPAGLYCWFAEYPDEGCMMLPVFPIPPEKTDADRLAERLKDRHKPIDLDEVGQPHLDETPPLKASGDLFREQVNALALECAQSTRASVEAIKADCPSCNIGNPGVYRKDGRMICPHRPERCPSCDTDTPNHFSWCELPAENGNG